MIVKTCQLLHEIINCKNKKTYQSGSSANYTLLYPRLPPNPSLIIGPSPKLKLTPIKVPRWAWLPQITATLSYVPTATSERRTTLICTPKRKINRSNHKIIGCRSGGRRLEFNRVASPRGTRPGTAARGTSRPSPQWTASPHLRLKTQNPSGSPEFRGGRRSSPRIQREREGSGGVVPLGSLMSFFPRAAMGAPVCWPEAQARRRGCHGKPKHAVGCSAQMLFWCSPPRRGEWSSGALSRRRRREMATSVWTCWCDITMVPFCWQCLGELVWIIRFFISIFRLRATMLTTK